MQAIKLKAMIDESHRLQLDLPADTPIGEAEVIVLLAQRTAPKSSQSLLEFFNELDRSVRPRLSAEEVERWVEAERTSWDRRDARLLHCVHDTG